MRYNILSRGSYTGENWARSRNINSLLFFNEVDKHIANVVKQQNCNPEWKRGEIVDEPYTDKPLYIYDRLVSTTCHKEHHPVIPEIYNASSIERDGIIRIPCHYCRKCEKYYIGAITYSMYIEKYGKMAVEKYVIQGPGRWEGGLQNESKLHRLGYNVIDGEMAEKERRDLLLWLIDHKRISYEEVSSTLEWDIRNFRNSVPHQIAVKKWEGDQKYISDLVKHGRIKNEGNK